MLFRMEREEERETSREKCDIGARGEKITGLRF
jgi:hypothetical protein